MTRGPSTEVRPLRTPSAQDTAGVDIGLAALAFGSVSRLTNIGQASGPGRHLVFLPTESLALDLTDPAQRAFGDYELLEMMGQGGMGVVYRARQASLDREVAVKLLSAGPWASADFIERFKREAQAAARMQHPNIVAIYEIGAHEELNFFSMRLVRGGSLAKLLQERRTLPPREAAKFLRTVAEALDYAHRLGVLHLDLKPGNVLIDAEGEPQVVDFGLARRLDESLSADSDEVSGTPSYMAPEQAQLNSHKLSPATDIYGLGGILYECLTGRPPFLASTAQETLRHVVTRELVPPRELDASIPRDLEAVCLNCLAKDPRERYQSAREFAEDLGRYIEGRAVTVRPLNFVQLAARWARREPRVASAAALLLLAVIAGFGATALQWRRAEYNSAAANSLLWESRRDAAVRLQKEGKGFEAVPRLLMNIVEQEKAGKLQAAELERRRVGTLLAQGAVLIDTVVVTDANPLALELSPAGKTLAIAFNDLTVRWYDTATLAEVGRVDLAGRPTFELRAQAQMPMLLRFVDERRLRVTLDWYANYPHPSESDTHLVDLDRAVVVEPPAAFSELADITYSSDGDHALLRNRSSEIQSWRVDPWQPLSALAPARGPLPWFLGRGGRFAVGFGSSLGELDFYDARDLSAPRRLALPATISISAWNESANAKWLALGDYEGRVFLVDTATLAVRQLPAPAGLKVVWTQFSEDDAWVAAGTVDGSAYVFDTQSGQPVVTGQIRHGSRIRRLGLDRRERLLVVTGAGDATVWRLGAESPQLGAPTRLEAGPTSHDLSVFYVSGWSPASGLFASAGIDGHVRLWRLPQPTRLDARAAAQVSEQLHFDGDRVVDVADNFIRVVDLRGNGIGDWTELPQRPGFAEVVGKGQILLVTTAEELRVYDAATMRLRSPAIPLPSSPQRMVASADGSVAVLTYPDSGPDGFLERLEVFDIRAGRRLPGTIDLGGPLRLLKLSRDNSRLLATGERNDSTVVLETRGLKRLGTYPHDETAPVLSAAFALDSDAIWLVVRDDDARLGADTLQLWDPDADVVREERSLPKARPFAVLPTPSGPFVVGFEQVVLDPGTERERVLVRKTREDDPAALALSPDGRLVAYADRTEVQLYDVMSRAPLGAAFPFAGTSNHFVAQLAFSPDGRWLLGRTTLQETVLWPIPPDPRPVPEIESELAWMGDLAAADGSIRSPSAQDRSALRRRDPGPWRADAPRPSAPKVDTQLGAIPARLGDADPMQLDLTSVYNVPPNSAAIFETNIGNNQIPFGLMRIKGVGYDVRGAIELHQPGSSAMQFAAPDRVTGIEVPAIPIAAFHVLLFASQPAEVADERTYARLRIHYRDGGEAVVAIRTQRDVPGMTRQDRPVPLGWAWNEYYRLTGYPDPAIFSDPRLENPDPERLVATIDLEVGDETFSAPVFFAITAAPVIRAAAPVIQRSPDTESD